MPHKWTPPLGSTELHLPQPWFFSERSIESQILSLYLFISKLSSALAHPSSNVSLLPFKKKNLGLDFDFVLSFTTYTALVVLLLI